MGISVPKPSLIRDSLSNRDLKLCNSWWCISSPQSSVSLPDCREAGSKLQGSAALREPSWEDVRLPLSQQQSAARARVTISSASRLLMSSLAALVSLTSELSWRLLKFSGLAFGQQFISCDFLERSGIWLVFLCLCSKTKPVLWARRCWVLAVILASIS